MGKAIILKSPDEIKIMQEANQIVAETLATLKDHIEPGQSTWQLNKLAEKFIEKRNATPAFKGYRGFPGSVCVSINEEVVHGIPSKKVLLKEGDIISIDLALSIKVFTVIQQ